MRACASAEAARAALQHKEDTVSTASPPIGPRAAASAEAPPDTSPAHAGGPASFPCHLDARRDDAIQTGDWRERDDVDWEYFEEQLPG